MVPPWDKFGPYALKRSKQGEASSESSKIDIAADRRYFEYKHPGNVIRIDSKYNGNDPGVARH
jgi:hypothetical protein